MPRNTKIFNPTFTGQATVRYGDVTKQPHYGQNDPYHGMPKGHLPVRSYLATPVISSLSGEVIGGLFFGHPEADVFTTESETLIEGIAAQAAIAMTNARLFQEKVLTEKKIRQSSEQYKSVFESTFDAIIIIDMDGQIVDTNDAARRMFGYPSSASMTQIRGERLVDAPPFKTILELVKSGRKFSGEGMIKTLHGGKMKVEVNVSSFSYGESPHMLAVFSSVADDSSKKAIEKIQNFSEVIANASPIALWMTNEKGENIFVNQTWIDWTGKSFDQHLNGNWASHIVPDDRQRVLDAFQTSLESRNILEIEYRIKRQDGKVIWCLVNGNPYYSRDGVFQGYAGSCMDITERKAIQEKLFSQNVLIKTITNNTRQALFMMDNRQYCTYMNPAAEQMTGFKFHEVQEKALHYYIHHTHPDGRHFPIEDCPIDRALPERMQTQGEDVFVHKDGHFYTVTFTASPIIENDVPKGTVIEVRDTTREKLMEAKMREKEQADKELLERKVKERTSDLEKMNYELLQFTSVASHDLKEPLRKIAVFSKMVRDRAKDMDLDQTFIKHIDHIVQSSGRMTKLIEDLLLFSRLSQDNLQFNDVDLNTLLTEIINDLEISIQEKNAAITVGWLPAVKGIGLQLGQVFQNLISNSLKFSHPERAPQIHITSDIIDKNDRKYYRIVYSDNGIGFDNQYAEKIFHIFQRLHTKEKYEGTGVGLAIVKKIIAMHDGEIRAHSIERSGTTFEILLPA